MQRRAEGNQLPVCARARPRVSSYSPAIPGCLPLVTRAGPRSQVQPVGLPFIGGQGRVAGPSDGDAH